METLFGSFPLLSSGIPINDGRRQLPAQQAFPHGQRFTGFDRPSRQRIHKPGRSAAELEQAGGIVAPLGMPLMRQIVPDQRPPGTVNLLIEVQRVACRSGQQNYTRPLPAGGQDHLNQALTGARDKDNVGAGAACSPDQRGGPARIFRRAGPPGAKPLRAGSAVALSSSTPTETAPASRQATRSSSPARSRPSTMACTPGSKAPRRSADHTDAAA